MRRCSLPSLRSYYMGTCVNPPSMCLPGPIPHFIDRVTSQEDVHGLLSPSPSHRHQGPYRAGHHVPSRQGRRSRQNQPPAGEEDFHAEGPYPDQSVLRSLDADASLVRACGQTPGRRRDEHVGRQFIREEGRNADRHGHDAERHATGRSGRAALVRGAAALLAQKVACSVVNAGDGQHEHPTQALLDALTIRRAKGKLSRIIVAICGDVLHSRVARSNILLLNAMGARVRVVAPRRCCQPASPTWAARCSTT